MDHERAVELVGQGDLGPERRLLGGAGRVLVVEVEAALADRHHLLVAGEVGDRAPLLVEAGRVVGVQADRGPHVGVPGGEVDRVP